MRKLTTLLPNREFDKQMIKYEELDNLTMADPGFDRKSKIEMILGADVNSEIKMSGIIRPNNNLFVLQETDLSWIISGLISKQHHEMNQSLCLMTTLNEIDKHLRQFWETEEIAEERTVSGEQQNCIDKFDSTIGRDSDGVYVVSQRINADLSSQSDSRRMTLAQFSRQRQSLENIKL